MITIVGLGALGSHVALFCRNMEPKLRLIDFDKVEAKNIKSQFHSYLVGIGLNKALSVGASLEGLFAKKDIEQFPRKVTPDNAKQLLGSSTVIVDCTDNLAARTTIQHFSGTSGIPCLHGGLSADGAFGSAVWTEWFMPDEDTGSGATCEDGENLPLYAQTSAVLASSVQEFLNTGRKANYHIARGSVLRV